MFKHLKLFSIYLLLIYCVIQNVNCDEEDSNKEVVDEETTNSALVLQHETIIQSDQPSSGERFVAIHVDAQGSKEQLRTTLKGLSNMAINYLPTSYEYIDVISATREVVAGVRYNIVVNALDENKEHTICDLVILEKPWIITQYGNKLKILEYTNCTAPEALPTAAGDNDDQQQIQYNTNPVFINQEKEMSEPSMQELESQILVGTMKPTIESRRTTTQTPAVDIDINTDNANDKLDDNSKNILDQFFMYGTFSENNNNANERVESTHVERLNNENLVSKSTIANENDNLQPAEPEDGTTTPATTFEMRIQKTFDEVLKTHQNIQRALDDVILHGGGRDTQKKYEPVFQSLVNQMKTQIDNYYKKQDQSEYNPTNSLNDEVTEPQITVTYIPQQLHYAEPILEAQQVVTEELLPAQDGVTNTAENPEFIGRSKRSIALTEKEYHLKLAQKALKQLDRLDTDNYKRVVVKIESITKMMKKKYEDSDEDLYYRMKIQVGVSECLENVKNSVDCNKKIMNNSLKHCTIEVRVRREAIQVTESKCAPDNSNQRVKRQLVGGPTNYNEEDARKYVTESLDHLKTVEGNNAEGFTLDSIVNSTVQVVSGKLIKIYANIISDGVTHLCYFEIWDQPWLKNGRKVAIDCGEDTKKYTFRHKRSMPHSRHFPTEVPKGEQHAQKLFDKFKLKHNRNYANSLEHDMRYRIFKNNLYKIEQLNRHEQGTAKYGVTEFSDLTSIEYKHRTGMLRRKTGENEIKNPIAEIPNEPLPALFDWRDKGVVTPVKNQGSCGSCWAFSVVGNIEGLYAIKNNKLAEFSEQELLDCDTVDQACNGGLPDNAYKALEQIGGLEYENEYPYLAKKESECHFNKTMSRVTVSGAVDLPKNETAMQQWLVANGPISIGINANAMQFYKGGVSHPWKVLCRSGSIDHGVLIVGYGIKDYPLFNKTMPYWIVKNSWGPSWGEQGYYRVYRGDNTCGISEMASSAVLA